MSSLRVAVRCRPFNTKERGGKQRRIVSMAGDKTVLINPKEEEDVPPRQFTFDHSFWSHNPDDQHFADQAAVYRPVGDSVLSDAFAGFHSCVFAYGQTGSGKSYTMMGAAGSEHRGITPRLCEELFNRIEARASESSSWIGTVEVSYMEIYMEQVRDLLNPKLTKRLKVREHKLTGPYVEDLSTHAVSNFAMVKELMEEGDKMRTVKATSMNDVSSRSHAIFQIIFSQGTQDCTEKVSKISLVDLAGSERSGQINAAKKKGDRFAEGNQINKSLSTLGKVMTCLAERRPGGKGPTVHIPYRESVLTWLLKESLGGNAKTFMMAAVSPAAGNYEETLSTLRYANQAKKIINAAVVNEDPKARLIRMLTEEIASLKAQLASATADRGPELTLADLSGVEEDVTQGTGPDETFNVDACSDGRSMQDDLLNQLEASQKLMVSLQTPWKDKVSKTRKMQQERLDILERHGIVVADNGDGMVQPVGVMTPKSTPYLVNMSHDPFSRHCLVYYIHEGETEITTFPKDDSVMPASTDSLSRSIMLQDEDAGEMHCLFVTSFEHDKNFFHVSLIRGTSASARILINGESLVDEMLLKSGDQLEFGNLAFVFQNPSHAMSIDVGAISRDSGAAKNSDFNLGQTSIVDSIMSDVSRIVPDMVNAGQSLDRKDALFTFNPEHESSYLVHLVVNMASSQFSFPLMPVYGLFMMFHGQRLRDERPLSDLQSRVACLLELIVDSSIHEDNLEKLILLLSNTSELLHAIRTDVSLVETSGAAQVTMVNCVEKAFTTIVAKAKKRIQPCIHAVLNEDIALSGARDGTQGATTNSQHAGMDGLVESLDVLFELLQNSLLARSLITALFESIFYYIGSATFNAFILSRDKAMFRWDRGLLIRFNVERLKDWCADHGLFFPHHFKHIEQAAWLLQANKSSLAYLDAICSACSSLNSLQVAKILKYYRPADGDSKLPQSIVDCITGRAMTEADRADQEDESVGGVIQLHRNENYELPFRLRGPFHVDTGMYNRQLLEEAKAYLRVIDLANNDDATITLGRISKSRKAGVDVRRAALVRSPRQSFFNRLLGTKRTDTNTPPWTSAREWVAGVDIKRGTK